MMTYGIREIQAYDYFDKLYNDLDVHKAGIIQLRYEHKVDERDVSFIEKGWV